MRRLQGYSGIVLLSLGLGCASLPAPGPDPGNCSMLEPPTVREVSTSCLTNRLVVGFFPSIGKAHFQGLATNGDPLTLVWRFTDYTARVGVIMITNVPFGIPPGRALLLDPYEPYNGNLKGPCSHALIGFCKLQMYVIERADPER